MNKILLAAAAAAGLWYLAKRGGASSASTVVNARPMAADAAITSSTPANPAFVAVNVSAPTPAPAPLPVVTISPAQIRDAQLTGMGLVNDGTGNYYPPEYFAGRDAALAARAANDAALTTGGWFSGVQG